MSRLPIYDIEDALLDALKTHTRLIIQAPTGSGKSTQVPQMLLTNGVLGDGEAVVLQPRRIAARMLGSRVAEELGTGLGEIVGYQVRFEKAVSPRTRIRYVTEGILLRRMIDDPLLRGVKALVFDEFHERHLYGDISLAQAVQLQRTRRPDLVIIVMSATLDTAALEPYLDPCHVLTSEGRTFPVDISYRDTRSRPSDPPVWELAADTLGRAIRQGAEGDALVFMPGAFEIHKTIQAIERLDEARGAVVLPLHGELNPRDQDAAVSRYDRRKIIVATNVAETSITIDGVRIVIDSGLARIPDYDPNRGINTLLIEKISRASSDQRAGRAGRTAPGHCYRLWSEPEHRERPLQETPEVRRLDLAETALMLKAAGFADLSLFPWLEAPDATTLERAETLLRDLGAADHNGVITETGRRMLAFPAHPRYARMLLAAETYGCVYQACLIAALTQGRDLLVRRTGKDSRDRRDDVLGDAAWSDFLILMRAWSFASRNQFRLDACKRMGIHAQAARQADAVFRQFLTIAERENLTVTERAADDDAVRKCILAGFSDHVARRIDKGTLRCEVVHNRRGDLSRDSVVQDADLIVAAEIHEIEGRSVNTVLSLATAIEAEWLADLYPEDMNTAVHVEYDPSSKRVQAEEQLRFRDLVLTRKRLDTPPADEAAMILAREVEAGRLTLKQWNHGVDQFIARLNFLSRTCPELELSPIDGDDRLHLIAQVCHGAAGYKDIKDRPVQPVIDAWLSSAQRHTLDTHAPERLALPGGRKAKLTYPPDGDPYISQRIQELYGLTETPRIAMKRCPVLIHVLAPNMREVQITADLKRFWQEHYPRIKQELQRRYPKHEWKDLNGTAPT